MADSTQFLIDIASKVSGLDDASGQLSMVAEKLTGVGTASRTLDSALAAAQAKLTGAASASKAASEAAADGALKYKQLEVAADRAAKNVEKAAQKGGVSPELQEKAAAATAALKGQAQALDALRAKASAAAAAEDKLAASVKALEAASKKAHSTEDAQAALARGSGKANEAAEAFGRFGGPLGMVGQKTLGLVEGLQKMTGALGPGLGLAAGGVAIAAALAAALIAVGVAAVVATVKIAAWAVGLADANRNQKLMLEGLSKTSPALANIGGIIGELEGKTTLGVDKLKDFAKQLAAAKVKAADMPAALKAVALAEDGLGEGEGAKLVEQLKLGKKTAAELAKEMQTNAGPIVARKLLGLDAQAAKFKKNLAGIFGDLKIEGFLTALQQLVGLFDKNTASGRTMKAAFELVFQPIIDGATKAIPLIKGFLIGIAIGALKAYVAFKPAIAALKELFGGADTKGLPSALETAIFLGKALGSTIALVVISIGAVAAALMLPIVLFQRVYQAGSAAWDKIKDGAAQVKTALGGLSLSDIGANIMSSLATGITNGGPKVISALGGVVQNAITAAKQKLGIASPSKVFAKLGGFTAEGFAGGVDAGAGDAQAAMTSMVEPPGAPTGSASVTAGGATYVFNLYGSAASMKEDVRRILTEIVNGTLTELGGTVTT